MLPYRFMWKKTRIVWLPDGAKSLMIRLVISIEYWLLACDGQMDGQTDILRQHSPCYAALCGKKQDHECFDCRKTYISSVITVSLQFFSQIFLNLNVFAGEKDQLYGTR